MPLRAVCCAALFDEALDAMIFIWPCRHRYAIIATSVMQRRQRICRRLLLLLLRYYAVICYAACHARRYAYDTLLRRRLICDICATLFHAAAAMMPASRAALIRAAALHIRHAHALFAEPPLYAAQAMACRARYFYARMMLHALRLYERC